MLRESRFSYACNACGLCCHDKVITLSPYDVLRMARAQGLSTSEVVDRFTIRRGSILRFDKMGRCSFLEGNRCSTHSGRPLACRLYPLGLERDGEQERFITLEPARGSLGVFGTRGTIDEFLETQSVEPYFAGNDRYRELLPLFRERINALIDFEVIEPREFWRCATREALAESNFDPNRIIDLLFGADRFAIDCSIDEATQNHLDSLKEQIACERDPAILAAAAVLLAVSLGYSPSEVIGG